MGADELYLRPITSADTDQIVTWRNRDFVWKNFIYQKPFTRAGHETWLREQVEPGHVAQFVICVADTDVERNGDCRTGAEGGSRGIGSVYLRDIDKKKGEAEYGIFIGERDALGKGYGTQAAKLMLDYGFETLGLKKIFLRLLADNPRALNSYRKAGFRLIKDKRETVHLEQGVQEVLFMEIDCGRWEEMKEKN